VGGQPAAAGACAGRRPQAWCLLIARAGLGAAPLNTWCARRACHARIHAR
jgi:hypothetical protein